ncbi:MAG: S41 family peptidase [Elainella sp. Prado103]|nr:S41 family peptidase [Elainella sp. Prado103]
MSQQFGYYRYPTVGNDRVVFVCEDDLWSVPVAGGVAHRLTANLGKVRRPLLSPDGRSLAFVGREEGHSEVYCMPAVGGMAQRLTFLGAAHGVGWSPDSQYILFASSAEQPLRHLSHLYRIERDGGLPELLPYGLAHSLAYGAATGRGFQVVLGRNTHDPAIWKRYRGGRVGVLWIDPDGNGTFRRLIDLPGNLTAPMWINDRIYFLSDHEGIGNLYSCTPNGEDLQQHTRQRLFYARNATTDGRLIVYHAGADLFCYDPLAQTDRLIPIEFHSPQIQRQRKFVDAAELLSSYDLHPEGHSVAITTRGQSFCFGNWEGPAFQLGQKAGVRYRLTRWLQDPQRLVTVADRHGDETLEILTPSFTVGFTPSADPSSAWLSGLDLGRIRWLEVSPTADQVVLSNHRHELIWVDLTSKTSQIIDRSDFHAIRGFAWAPDGQWVTYSCAETQETYSIKLWHQPTGETHQLTQPRFRDVAPCFDPSGKFIYFLSQREFNPVYDNLYFDLSFPKSMRPFLIALKADTPSPFVLSAALLNGQNSPKTPEPIEPSPQPITDPASASPAELPPASSDPEHPLSEAAKSTEKSEKSITVEVDLEGIHHRVLGFPVSEGIYRQIWGVEGKVLFLTEPVRGSLDHRMENGGNGKTSLEMYDFESQKQERIASEVSSFRVGKDGKTLIYRSGHRLRVCGISPQDRERKDTEPGRKSGWLDLDRVRVAVNPVQEWQQMFREVWQLQQEQFWTADMSGVDWAKVYDRYRPLLDRVAVRSEFADLVDEMQGELGTSHAYEWGGDYRDEPDYRLGLLGADFRYDPQFDAYRIAHIIQGDTWTDQASPLQQLGVNIKVGDLLLAIGGERVSRHQSPQSLLVNQAHCEVALTFAEPSPPVSTPLDGSASETSTLDGSTSETSTSETPTSETPTSETPALEPVTLETSSVEPPIAWTGQTRTITVKTLASDHLLRYREWVECNYQQVAAATNGQVGYIHVPDMSAFGYAEFHRYYFAEVHKPGLIIDVRYNGGGHVSQLILEKLARRRIGYDVSRWGKPEPYPVHSIAGPIVALTNEYAGSDGDVFSHAFKLMQLGILVGQRTWGGVIGISPKHRLVDGGTVTQPEYAFWFQDVGWQVENYGTDPDIEVEITPQDWVNGCDTQLEKAIELILEKLTKEPVILPDFSDRPYLPLPS